MKKFFAMALVAVMSVTLGIGGGLAYCFGGSPFSASQEDSVNATSWTTPGTRHRIWFNWGEYGKHFTQYDAAIPTPGDTTFPVYTSLWVDFGTDEQEVNEQGDPVGEVRDYPANWKWYLTEDSKEPLDSIPWHIFGATQFFGFTKSSISTSDTSDLIVNADGTFNKNCSTTLLQAAYANSAMPEDGNTLYLVNDMEVLQSCDPTYNYNQGLAEDKDFLRAELNLLDGALDEASGSAEDRLGGLLYFDQINEGEYETEIMRAWALWDGANTRWVVVNNLKEAYTIVNQGSEGLEWGESTSGIKWDGDSSQTNHYFMGMYETATYGRGLRFVDMNGNFCYQGDSSLNGLDSWTSKGGIDMDSLFTQKVLLDWSIYNNTFNTYQFEQLLSDGYEGTPHTSKYTTMYVLADGAHSYDGTALWFDYLGNKVDVFPYHIYTGAKLDKVVYQGQNYSDFIANGKMPDSNTVQVQASTWFTAAGGSSWAKVPELSLSFVKINAPNAYPDEVKFNLQNFLPYAPLDDAQESTEDSADYDLYYDGYGGDGDASDTDMYRAWRIKANRHTDSWVIVNNVKEILEVRNNAYAHLRNGSGVEAPGYWGDVALQGVYFAPNTLSSARIDYFVDGRSDAYYEDIQFVKVVDKDGNFLYDGTEDGASKILQSLNGTEPKYDLRIVWDDPTMLVSFCTDVPYVGTPRTTFYGYLSKNRGFGYNDGYTLFERNMHWSKDAQLSDRKPTKSSFGNYITSGADTLTFAGFTFKVTVGTNIFNSGEAFYEGNVFVNENMRVVAQWDDYVEEQYNHYANMSDGTLPCQITALSVWDRVVELNLHSYRSPDSAGDNSGPSSSGNVAFADGTKEKTLYYFAATRRLATNKDGTGAVQIDANPTATKNFIKNNYVVNSASYPTLVFTNRSLGGNNSSLEGAFYALSSNIDAHPDDWMGTSTNYFNLLKTIDQYERDEYNIATSVALGEKLDLYLSGSQESLRILFTLSQGDLNNKDVWTNPGGLAAVNLVYNIDNDVLYDYISTLDTVYDALPDDKYVGRTTRASEYTFDGFYSGENGAGTQIFDGQGNFVGKAYLKENYPQTYNLSSLGAASMKEIELFSAFKNVWHSVSLNPNEGEFVGGVTSSTKTNPKNLQYSYSNVACSFTTAVRAGFFSAKNQSSHINFETDFALSQSLYKPTRDKYIFLGYYTKATGGVKVIDADGKWVKSTGDTQILDNKISTLYAHWELDEVNLGSDDSGNAAAGVSSVVVNFTNPNAVYNGQAWQPEVTSVVISYSAGGSDTLTQPDNFTVGYGVNINAGQGTITVTFQGRYHGSRTVTFDIGKRDIGDAQVKIELERTTSTYGEFGVGVAFKPNVESANDELTGKSLTATTDYSVAYGTNIYTNDWYDGAPSSQTSGVTAANANFVTISGNGNYTGEKKILLTINRASIETVNIDSTELVYNGKSQQPEITSVLDNFKHTISSNYYDVSVVRFNSDTAADPTLAGRYRLKVSAKSDQYYYQSAQYADFEIVQGSISGGEGEHTGGTGTGSGLSVSVSDNNLKYNGQVRSATVTIILNGTRLIAGSDFSVTYNSTSQNNVSPKDVGTYTIHVSASSSNYSGEFDCSSKLVISPASLSGATVTASVAHSTYTRATNPITISRVVTNSANYSLTLSSGDYTYSPENAEGTGYVTVTVYGRGNFTDSASTSVYVAKADITKFQISADGISSGTSAETSPTLNLTFKGSAFEPTYTVQAGSITLLSSEYSVQCTRGSSNTSDFTSYGTINVKVTANSSSNFTGTLSGQIVIAKKAMTSGDLTFSWTNDTVVWHPESARGHADAKPTYTISWGRIALNEGRDYSTDYDLSTVGNGIDFTITFTGNYSGTVTEHFNITARTFDEVEFGSIPSQTYTGSALSPTFSARDTEAAYDLKKGTDYQADYSSNTDKGEATVQITGLGGYVGASKTLHFQIVGKNISGCTIEDVDEKYTYGEDITLNPTVKDGGKTLNDDVDYEWKLEKQGGDGWSEVPSKTPDGVGNYRVHVYGKDNYSGDITQEFSVEAKTMGGGDETTEGGENGKGENSSFTWDVDFSTATDGEFIYDRDAHTPGVIVKEKGGSGKTLVSGQDYDLKYENNTNAGTATITITAKGNYSGTLTAHFVISPAKISSLTLSKTSAIYNMLAQNDNITIGSITTENLLTLLTGEYTVSYSYGEQAVANPTDAGIVTVKVENNSATTEGKNFTGSATAQFEIFASKITGLTLSGNTQVKYDGKEHRPQIATVLTEGCNVTGENITTNFTFTYQNDKGVALSNFTDAGKIVVLVKISDGNKNFANAETEVKVTFEILKRSLTEIGTEGGDLEIEYYISETSDSSSLGDAQKWSEDSQVYVGQFVVPKIFHNNFGAENAKHQLADGTDYHVVYELQKNVEGDVWDTVTEVKDVGRYKLNIKTEFDDGSFAKNYVDSYTMEYNVYAAEFSPETIEIEYYQNGEKLGDGKKIEFVYNGKAQTITVDSKPQDGAYIVLKDKRPPEEHPQQEELVYGRDFEIVNEHGGEEQVPVKGADGSQTTQVTPVNGYINNVEVGTANLFLKGKGNFQGQYIIIEFVIKQLTMLDEDGNLNKDAFTFELDLSEGPFVYKNAAFTPSLSKAQWNGQDLHVGEDYSIDYRDNVDATTSDKKAKVVITGSGNFSGEFTLEFEIQQHSIAESDISVKMTKTFEFTGSAINPQVVVTMGEYQLNSDSRNDYTIAYEFDEQGNGTWTSVQGGQCIQKGKYRVVITGQGNFNNTRYETFDITAFALSGDKIEKPGVATDADTWALDDIEFDWKEHKVEPKLQLKLGDGSKRELVKDQDYELSYDKEDFVNVGTIKITVIGKAEGDYSGTLYFTYKIVEADISKTPRFSAAADGFEDNMEVTFKNSAFTFDFVITDTERPQDSAQNVTFETAYAPDNTAVGEVTITLTGNGNFKGQIIKKFTIKPVNFDGGGNVEGGGEEELPNLTIGELKNFTYDGKTHEQSVDLHFGEYQLRLNDDYSVQYGNDGGFVNAQTITLTVEGKGNFKFTLNLSYEIKKVDISSGLVTSQFVDDFSTERVFSGDAFVIRFTLQYLVEGSPVDVTYSVKYTQNGSEDNANINAGTVTMTIEGTDNYTGTIVNTFEIKPKNLSDFAESNFAYNRSVQWAGIKVEQPDLKLRYNGRDYTTGPLTFELSYENNTGLSDNAKIHITGQGNFDGEYELTFRIVAKVIDPEKIEVEIVYPDGKDGYTYTGEEIVPEIKVYVTDDTSQRTTLDADDFEIVYQDDHTNVGEHSFYVDLVGDYAGQSAYNNFKIVAADLSESASQVDVVNPDDVTYDGLQHILKPTLKLSAENVDYELIEGVDYEVSYFTEKNGETEETDFVNAHTINFKISAHGTNFTGEVWGSYNISAKDLSDENEVTIEYQASWAYTGQAIQPEVTVKYKSANNTITLQKGENFNVDYRNNTNVTTEAEIIVSSLGSDTNYIGSRTLKFSIGSISFNDYHGISVDTIGQQKYMARDIEPKVVVRLNGQEIVNTDNSQYTISYKRDASYPGAADDHKNVGTVTVVITATDGGNFTGTIETTFEIVPQLLNEAKVQLKGEGGDFADWVDGTQYKFLAKDITPGSGENELKITINNFTDVEGQPIQLVVGTDVALAYTNAQGQNDTINVGEKLLTISAISNNFSGTKVLNYTIVALDLNDTEGNQQDGITVEVRGWKDQLVYNQGKPVEQTYNEDETQGYSLRINGVVVDPDTYVVNYTYTRDTEGNVIIGAASGTFVNKLSVGNFVAGSSIVKTFEIIKADVTFVFDTPEQNCYEGQEFADIFRYRAKDKNDTSFTVEGTFTFTIDGQEKTVVEVGTHTYNFEFTPNNSNFNSGSGTVTVVGLQLVVERIEASANIDYIDGVAFDRNTLKVQKIYNSGDTETMTSDEYDIDGLVDGIYLSYENGFTVFYKLNRELYDTIYVRPTKLGGEDGVEVRSSKGFDEGILMKIEKISDIQRIVEIIGDEAYGKLSNVRYLYRIVFYKFENGEEVEVDTVTDYEVWIDLNRLEGGLIPYMVFGGEVTNLSELADENGYVQLTPATANIVLVASKRGIWTNWIFWVILIATIIFLLILLTLVLVYIREQRKRQNQRKLEAKTNA